MNEVVNIVEGDPLAHTRDVSRVLARFTSWLDGYGEVSWDHQSYFAGPIGGRAKALYYRNKALGTAAVAPMIFSEAFLPAARRLFDKPRRFPIADAHYAMGFAFLSEAVRPPSSLLRPPSSGEGRDTDGGGRRTEDGSNPDYLARAVHFLEELKKSRCSAFKEFCWGYPFDWVTRNGVIKEQTPFITSTPYIYEAFLQVHQIAPRDEWRAVLDSIIRHVCSDIKDFPSSKNASTCSYSPFDKGGVINASAYRSAMLTSAAKVFGRDDCWSIAERNLNFVLENQNPDGSWPYAVDGVRDFVDHFHTCFVMKALAKIHTLTGHASTLAALERGVDYYTKNLFGPEGLPRPFAKAPRLTVYKCELYDCAESINLCLLLRDRFPQLNAKLETVVSGILNHWVKPDGSFRSRKLIFGWDNVPMHRWAQSQMFRALSFYAREARRAEDRGQRAEDGGLKTGDVKGQYGRKD